MIDFEKEISKLRNDITKLETKYYCKKFGFDDINKLTFSQMSEINDFINKKFIESLPEDNGLKKTDKKDDFWND